MNLAFLISFSFSFYFKICICVSQPLVSFTFVLWVSSILLSVFNRNELFLCLILHLHLPARWEEATLKEKNPVIIFIRKKYLMWLFLTFCFYIIIDSQEVVNIGQEDLLYHSCGFPCWFNLNNYSTTSKLGNLHCCNMCL